MSDAIILPNPDSMIHKAFAESGKLMDTTINWLKHRNPYPFDARIAYLESTGTQYLDTGVTATGYTTAQGEFSDISYPAGTDVEILFGSREDAGGYKLFSASVYSDRIQFYYNGSSALTYIGTAANRAVIRLAPDEAAVNNLTSQLTSIKTDYVKPIYIFRRSCPDGVSPLQCSGGRLHSFQIQESGILVRDFIPVRVGSVGYLYDKVSGQLFGNAGTGEFVCGPDKKIPTAKDYIQDGLVAMWDGIENAGWNVHDENATVWQDLIGNNNISINKTGISVDKDRVSFRNSAYIDNTLSGITIKTIEIVCAGGVQTSGSSGDPAIYSNNGWKLQYLPSRNVAGWGVAGAYNPNWWNRPGVEGKTFGAAFTCDGSTRKEYFNGTIFNTRSNSGNIPSNNIQFCRDSNARTMNGDILCVRLFNRILTDTEIIQNYIIDKERFYLS